MIYRFIYYSLIHRASGVARGGQGGGYLRPPQKRLRMDVCRKILVVKFWLLGLGKSIHRLGEGRELRRTHTITWRHLFIAIHSYPCVSTLSGGKIQFVAAADQRRHEIGSRIVFFLLRVYFKFPFFTLSWLGLGLVFGQLG